MLPAEIARAPDGVLINISRYGTQTAVITGGQSHQQEPTFKFTRNVSMSSGYVLQELRISSSIDIVLLRLQHGKMAVYGLKFRMHNDVISVNGGV